MRQKKNKIYLALILSVCLLAMGCKTTNADEGVVKDEVVEVEETVSQNVISPLPVTIDMNNLDNCTVAVSFEEGDAYVDDSGIMQLDATVYTYDLYDMVDISLLKEGDSIVIREQEVKVDSLEKNELGTMIINGGLENNGYELFTDESGVYFENGFNDVKSYYALGETTVRVNVDFEFVDNYDIEKGEQIYYPGDFLIEEGGIIYDFNPNNTNIVIEDGQIIKMIRVFTP